MPRVSGKNHCRNGPTSAHTFKTILVSIHFFFHVQSLLRCPFTTYFNNLILLKFSYFRLFRALFQYLPLRDSPNENPHLELTLHGDFPLCLEYNQYCLAGGLFNYCLIFNNIQHLFKTFLRLYPGPWYVLCSLFVF